METTIIICFITFLISCVLCYFIGYAAGKRRNQMRVAQSIIKYDLQPIELTFEREWDAQEAYYRGLSKEEELYQRRRKIAMDVVDGLYPMLMEPDTALIETTTSPKYRSPNEPFYTKTTIRVLPVKRI